MGICFRHVPQHYAGPNWQANADADDTVLAGMMTNHPSASDIEAIRRELAAAAPTSVQVGRVPGCSNAR
jgi:hypothetical protein